VKEDRKHSSDFEEKLLDELKAIVAQRGAEQTASTERPAQRSTRRRAPRLALGGAAVFTAAVAVLVIGSGGDNAPKAFAVEPQDGGGVTIRIYSAEDAAGLEGALADAGIPSQVTWLPAGKACREPHFTQSTAKTSMGGAIGGINMAGPGKAMTIGVMSPEQYRERAQERAQEYNGGEISESEAHDSIPNISLDPASFRPDQTVVISGSRGAYEGDPEGGFEATLSIAEGQVEPCDPVKAPAGGPLEEVNRILEAESNQRQH